MKKQLPYICLLVLLCLLLTACGSSQLIGRWVEEDGNDMLIFRKDGTGSADGFRFDWYISNGRLHIVLFEDEEMAFSVRGNKLSLQDVYSDGSLSRNVDVYIRQGGPSVPIGTIVFCVIIAALLIISIRFGVFEKMLKHLPVDKELAESTTKAMGLDENESEKYSDKSTQSKEKIPDFIAQVKEKAPEAIAQVKEKLPDTIEKIKEKATSVPLHESKEKSKMCSRCHHAIPSDAIFCPECGEKVISDEKERICPQCGAELPDEAIFCPGCGSKVDDLRLKEKEDRETHVLHDKPVENKPTPTKRKLTDDKGEPSEEDSSISNLIRVWFKCPSCGARFERYGTKDTPPEFGYCYRCHYDGKSPLAGNGTRIKISKNFNQQKTDTDAEIPDSNVAFAPEKNKYTTYANKRTVDSITENTTIEPSPGMKICPNCKTEIRRGAFVCKHCGYDFDMM